MTEKEITTGGGIVGVGWAFELASVGPVGHMSETSNAIVKSEMTRRRKLGLDDNVTTRHANSHTNSALGLMEAESAIPFPGGETYAPDPRVPPVWRNFGNRACSTVRRVEPPNQILVIERL
jgi:hypothetical protein